MMEGTRTRGPAVSGLQSRESHATPGPRCQAPRAARRGLPAGRRALSRPPRFPLEAAAPPKTSHSPHLLLQHALLDGRLVRQRHVRHKLRLALVVAAAAAALLLLPLLARRRVAGDARTAGRGARERGVALGLLLLPLPQPLRGRRHGV